MNYRLIALDLDGTLLGSRKVISPRNRAALLKLRERPIAAVIATGRTVPSARYFGRQIGATALICCNGAVVVDEAGAVITSKPIPSAPLVRALQLCAEAKLPVECHTERGLLFDRPFAQVAGYFSWVRPRLTRPGAFGAIFGAWVVNRVRPMHNLAAKAAKGQLPPIFKVMATGSAGDLERVAGMLRRTVPGLELTSSGPYNLELTAAGVSKGSALRQLAARLRIPREAIVAMGDSDNDVVMLEYAGLGIAMGNGTDSVKTVARQVAPPVDEDGVAFVVETLIGDSPCE